MGLGTDILGAPSRASERPWAKRASDRMPSDRYGCELLGFGGLLNDERPLARVVALQPVHPRGAATASTVQRLAAELTSLTVGDVEFIVR